MKIEFKNNIGDITTSIYKDGKLIDSILTSQSTVVFTILEELGLKPIILEPDCPLCGGQCSKDEHTGWITCHTCGAV